jgi:plastocyanin
MSRKLITLSVALVAIALAACGGRYNGSTAPNGGTYALPGIPGFALSATLPNGGTGTIGVELSVEGLGTIDDSFWKANLSGYTQQKFSQALGFPPGTKITLTNLSKFANHTLNYVKKISGPPATFPTSPKLSLKAHGNGKLVKGYASGILGPGKSVTVTLSKAGIYLIGCAIHYGEGLRDVIVVKTGATPGPEATPPGR